MHAMKNILSLRLLLISGCKVPGKFAITMQCCDGLTDCLFDFTIYLTSEGDSTMH